MASSTQSGRLKPYSLRFRSEDDEKEYQTFVAGPGTARVIMLCKLGAAVTLLLSLSGLVVDSDAVRNSVYSNLGYFTLDLLILWTLGLFGREIYQLLMISCVIVSYGFSLARFRLATSGTLSGDDCTAHVDFYVLMSIVSTMLSTIFYLPWLVAVVADVGVFACWFSIVSEHDVRRFGFLFATVLIFNAAITYEGDKRDRTNYILLADADAGLKAKAAFLANQNHEMRTLLNGIIGMRDLLADTALDALQSDFLSVIHRCSEALLAMICDVLDLEKAIAGKLELHSTPFSVRECIESVGDMLCVQADSKHVELACVVDSALAPLTLIGDADRLRQILLNLGSNAIKFSSNLRTGRAGQVTIRAVLLAAADSTRMPRVVFSVVDNGIGIKDEHVELLFQPFSQIDSSHTRAFQGTGLGLAICKKFAEAMGGKVAVKSREGAGSTFSVTIPFPAATSPSDASQSDLFIASTVPSVTSSEVCRSETTLPDVGQSESPAAVSSARPASPSVSSAGIATVTSRDNRLSPLAIVAAADDCTRSALCELLHELGWSARALSALPERALHVDAAHAVLVDSKLLSLSAVNGAATHDDLTRRFGLRTGARTVLVFSIRARLQFDEVTTGSWALPYVLKPVKLAALRDVLKGCIRLDRSVSPRSEKPRLDSRVLTQRKEGWVDPSAMTQNEDVQRDPSTTMRTEKVDLGSSIAQGTEEAGLDPSTMPRTKTDGLDHSSTTRTEEAVIDPSAVTPAEDAGLDPSAMRKEEVLGNHTATPSSHVDDGDGIGAAPCLSGGSSGGREPVRAVSCEHTEEVGAETDRVPNGRLVGCESTEAASPPSGAATRPMGRTVCVEDNPINSAGAAPLAVGRTPFAEDNPIKSPGAASSPSRAASSPSGAATRPMGRILCAEDNSINQRVLGGLLKKLGCEFDFVDDGQAAVDAAATGQYSTVLMDVQMPIMSGLEATAAIRRLEARQLVPRHVIVGCSANAFTESRDECFQAGMDLFIAKPIRKDELALLIRNCSRTAS